MTEDDYIGTMLVVHELDKRYTVVIPKDITNLEAACFAAFVTEWTQRFVTGSKWQIGERLGHYQITRFLVEGDQS